MIDRVIGRSPSGATDLRNAYLGHHALGYSQYKHDCTKGTPYNNSNNNIKISWCYKIYRERVASLPASSSVCVVARTCGIESMTYSPVARRETPVVWYNPGPQWDAIIVENPIRHRSLGMLGYTRVDMVAECQAGRDCSVFGNIDKIVNNYKTPNTILLLLLCYSAIIPISIRG